MLSIKQLGDKLFRQRERIILLARQWDKGDVRTAELRRAVREYEALIVELNLAERGVG